MAETTQYIFTEEDRQEALQFSLLQIRRNIDRFAGFCQNHSSVGNFYPKTENNQWTCGFWPGEIWLAYEISGDNTFKQAGEDYITSFSARIKNKIEVEHHDMGFLYTPSCVAPYKIYGNPLARDAAILAADQLISRFQPVGEFIQAWGKLGAADNYRYIVDCLLNLPLLYWASDVSGNTIYKEIAHKHLTTCLRYSFRPDGSTYHTVFMNPENGSFVRGETCQGYSNESSWARGQAWAIYGTAISYHYARNPEYKETFYRALDYYQSRLPQDFVPFWDLIFTDGDPEPRDSSSAAIVACGLLEMADLEEEEGNTEAAASLRKMAGTYLAALCKKYRVQTLGESDGLLLHGTYSKKSPYNTCTPEGVDECVSWGDYFYLEALVRMSGKWHSYW